MSPQNAFVLNSPMTSMPHLDILAIVPAVIIELNFHQ